MHNGPGRQLELERATSRSVTYLSETDLLSIPAVFPRFPQPLDHLHSFLDTEEMDESVLLVPDHLDNINIPKCPHFLRYLILAHFGIDIGDIDSPSGFLGHYCIDDFSVHPWLFSCHVDV